jgi:acyl-coenzyme A thioesterase PaaI-like protein
MDLRTHGDIDRELCGIPQDVAEGFSRVRLHTNERMAVDESGLVHGGFIFGLADYAAMIAVNHPNVVLGAAEVRFLKPVKVNDIVIAEANVDSTEGKKSTVTVTVKGGETEVFKGEFACFSLEKHVLAT